MEVATVASLASGLKTKRFVARLCSDVDLTAIWRHSPAKKRSPFFRSSFGRQLPESVIDCLSKRGRFSWLGNLVVAIFEIFRVESICNILASSCLVSFLYSSVTPAPIKSGNNDPT